MPLPHLTTVALHVELSGVSGRLDNAIRALRGLAGVDSVATDVTTGALMVSFDRGTITVATLVGCLAGQGLPATRAQVVEDGTASPAE